MNIIDTAQLQYTNRTLKVPESHSSNSRTIDKKSDLYTQCEEFESIFIKMMLTEMKKSVEKSGLTDGGMAEDIFSDMLYDEYAKNMASSANFGLSDQIYLQLTGRR